MGIGAVAVADVGGGGAADSRQAVPLHAGSPRLRLLRQLPHHNGNRDLCGSEKENSWIYKIWFLLANEIESIFPKHRANTHP